MTSRVVEGWDYLPNGAQLALLQAGGWYYRPDFWGIGIPSVISPGRFDFGKAMSFTGMLNNGTDVGRTLVKPIGSDETEGVMGAAVFIGGGHFGYFYLSFFDAVSGVCQLCVSFESYGIVRVYRGEPTVGGVQIGIAYAGTYYYNEWMYVEVKATIDNTAGAVEVRINTIPIITLASVDTQYTANAYYDSIAIGCPRGNATARMESWSYDDVYLNDTAGSLNNDFLGNVRVHTQFVTANGTPLNFTIGGSSPAATNWQSVLNTALNDTKYVHSATPGDRDFYTVEAIVNAPAVHVVQIRSAMRQDDATQMIGRNSVKSGATIGDGGDHYTNQTYTFYFDRFEVNPDTGVGWLGTEVNAMLIGPKEQA